MNQLKTQRRWSEKYPVKRTDSYWHPLGLTALMYLREALQNERFEDCKVAAETAREFGAQEWEIRNILNVYFQ